MSGKIREKYTIAICTHNRKVFARQCVESTLKIMGDREIGLLLIDNASSDGTKDFINIADRRLTYIYEPSLGLSHARNAALAACQTSYIVFLDDDAIPTSSWIDGIDEAISANADVFGGPYIPFYTSEKPDWFDDSFGSAHLDLANGWQDQGTCFSGGNMGWRLSLVRSYGGFDPKLGMIGDRLGLAEETALQIRMHAKSKARFWFSQRMCIRHYVDVKKISLRYIVKRNYHYGKTLTVIEPSNRLPKLTLSTFVRSTKFGLPLVYRFIRRDTLRYPHWKTYAARYLTLHAIHFGILLGKREIERNQLH